MADEYILTENKEKPSKFTIRGRVLYPSFFVMLIIFNIFLVSY